MSKRYVLEPGVIDLETTEVFDKLGNRIDNAYVDAAVADIHARFPVGHPPGDDAEPPSAVVPSGDAVVSSE